MIFKRVNGLILKIFNMLIFCSFILSQNLHFSLFSEGHKKPIYLTSIKEQSNTFFIVEQRGVIKIMVENSKHHIVLNIKDKVHQTKMPGDERGLLGMALHPDFINNGKFYVNYVNREGNSIISSFKYHSDMLKADPLSEKIMLSIEQPYSNHNGGQLAFGPDGSLYVGLGDGGYAGDPKSNGQNLSTLLGKILRLNLDGSDSYSIPDDNPFFHSKEFKKEIFIYGLRNPWRFSFDRETGDLYIADVGQSTWEEINYSTFDDAFGSNFGWNVMEGSSCYPIGEKCASDDFILPIFEYPNNANYIKTLIGWDQNNAQGCSVTGGYVYRGKLMPEIYGQYFFGDYCTGKIWSLKINNNKLISHVEWNLKGVDEDLYLASFGEDGNGELYIINHTGKIYKMTGLD